MILIMKDLIYMEQEEISKFDCLQELYEFIFGKHYFELTEKEKFIRRYEIAFYKIKFYKQDLDIVHTKIGVLGEKYQIINQNYEFKKGKFIRFCPYLTKIYDIRSSVEFWQILYLI